MNSRDMNSRVTLHRLTISRCLSALTFMFGCKQLLPESVVLSKRRFRSTSGLARLMATVMPISTNSAWSTQIA